MSLKKNTVANYIGQGYTALVSILILPLYLNYLGAEAYGLVGFFIVLQAWLQILDMGLSPTLGRQVAHSRVSVSKISMVELRKLIRSMEIVLFFCALLIVISIWSIKFWLASKWLKLEELPINDVSYCIALMGFLIGMRLLSSLYRSGIQGMERQVWLNGANIFVASFRFIGAYIFLRFISREVILFFQYQFFISLTEMVLFCVGLYRYLPRIKEKGWYGFSWQALKPVFPFVGGIAYTATIWVMVTQIDKLILSKALSLTEYGYFTLVAVISNGLMMMTGPISQAILPRMTYLLSQGKDDQMLVLYRKATQFVAILVFSVVGVISINSTEFLFAWTGNREASEWAGPVLLWFALGNCILGLAAFQYYLQFAYGKLKLHILNSSINIFLQIPIIVYAAFNWGAVGVGICWFCIRLFSFIVFPTIVHHLFAKGLHKLWLFYDIGPVFGVSLFSVLILRSILPLSGCTRIEIIAGFVGSGILLFAGNVLVSSAARSLINGLISKISKSFMAHQL